MKVFITLLVSGLLFVSCQSQSPNALRGVAGTKSNFGAMFRKSVEGINRKNMDETLGKYGTAQLKPSKAYLLRDNDRSFASKIHSIRKAKKSIDMVYYIYSDDESSSFISQELIKAANRGVKVRLLVDYIFNFSNYDYFQMLRSQGIQVAFYNQPMLDIQAFAEYLVTVCPPESKPDADCSIKKWKDIGGRLSSSKGRKQLGGMSTNAKRFIAGFYAQNGTLLQSSLSAHNLDFFTEGPATSDEDKAALTEFIKLLFNLKVRKKDYVSNGIKYMIAMALYGDKLRPIENTVDSFVPTKILNSRQFPYITDYTHHKLLLVDNKYMQLGGRNIENSYHFSDVHEMIHKYLFRDTDVWMDLTGDAAGGLKVAASYDRLWNHPTTALLENIPNHADIPFLMIEKSASIATKKQCKDNKECAKKAYKGNLGKAIAGGAATIKNLLEARGAELGIKANAFDTYRKNKLVASDLRTIYGDTNGSESLSFTEGTSGAVKIATDLEGSSFHYLENIKKSGSKGTFFGARIFQEGTYGKAIHHVWMKAIEDNCRQNAKGDASKVLIHNAYYSPPSNLLRTMGQQLNGRSNAHDCANVSYEVVTNSLNTTDLAPINMIARRQMIEMNNSLSRAGKSKLGYWEYTPLSSAAPSGGAKVKSLHTKALLIKDDLYIGSANADIRSLMMDTNNGIYIRRHPEVAKEYTDYIESLKKNNTVAKASNFYEMNRGTAQAIDSQIYKALFAKFKAERWVKGPQSDKIEQTLLGILNTVSSTSKNLLQYDFQSPAPSDPYKDFFKFDEYFKVF